MTPINEPSAIDETPLTLVDIGSSGGISPVWRTVKDLTVVEFEPDERAPDPTRDWPRRRVLLRTPLWECPQEMAFHLTAKQQASSLFRPNQELFNRYPNAQRVHIRESRRVRVDTLANQLHAAGVERVDFIKLDAQGAELAILRGAEELLRRYVVGLEIEVEFLPLYHGQPLFGEVDAYVRSLGFELFQLRPTQWKYAEDAHGASPGQLAFGDALYFRSVDSIHPRHPDAQRQLAALAAIARVHRHTDFAAHVTSRASALQR